MSVCSGRADKPRAGLSPDTRAAGMGSKRLWSAEHHDAAQTGLLGAALSPEWGQADSSRNAGIISTNRCRTIWFGVKTRCQGAVRSGAAGRGGCSSNSQANRQTALQCAARLLGPLQSGDNKSGIKPCHQAGW